MSDTTSTLETPATAAVPEPANTRAPSQLRAFVRSFCKHRLAVLGLVVLVLMASACALAGVIAPYPQGQENLLLGATPPSSTHLLGTDQLGSDYLTEILYAGRISLTIGIFVALLSTLIGTVLGIVAGYWGSWAGEVLMRVTDLFLIVPSLVLLAIALQLFGRSSTTIILVLACLSWTYIARIVRGEVLSLRELAYIDAARVLGATHRRIIGRHILPNLAGVISVNVSLAVAGAIIAESTLSYLGFGVQPPKTSWGTMLSAASGYIGTPLVYLLYFPGLAIFITVLAISFVGDGLRDALDPRKIR